MRTRFAVPVLAMVMIAILAIPAISIQSANAAEAAVGGGFGIVFSSGTDKVQWESRLVLKGEKSGVDLAPINGIVSPWWGEGTIGQIVIIKDGTTKPEDFRFSFSTRAAPAESDWTDAKFDPDLGYLFRVGPEKYVDSMYDTPFQLRVTIRNGKSKYVRVFFKITYGHSDTTAREVLFIRPCDPPTPAAATSPQVVADQAAIDANFAAVKAALGVIEENQQSLLGRVNDNAGRLDNLEGRMARMEAGWAAQAGNPPSSAVSAPPLPRQEVGVTVEQLLREKYAGRAGYVFHSVFTVTKSWWLSSRKGWVRTKNDLTVSSVEESCWLYDASDLARRGWTGFGFGQGNTPPTEWYPLNNNLTVMEVR